MGGSNGRTIGSLSNGEVYMPRPEAFKKVEDEYFRLKDQFGAGKITRQQLDSALNKLAFPYKGHYWNKMQTSIDVTRRYGT
jgi:Ca2+-binding EF-hand superfamily protein